MDKSALQNILIDQGKEIFDSSLWARSVDLRTHLSSQEISVITGVRRCGKSSLLSLIAGQLGTTDAIFYLNFEDVRLVSFQLEDFQRALDAWLELRPSTPQKIFFFYDEIQDIANWQRWVTHLAKNKKYKVFITGSNSNMLSGELASLLTGRHKTITLFPFSFSEIAGQLLGDVQAKPGVSFDSEMRLELRRLFHVYMEYGGFPRVYISKDRSLLSQYFVDIVLKDIVIRKNIRNERALLELGTILMSDATGVVNKTKLASSIAVKDADTVSSYIHSLGETYLGFEMKLFHYSRQKELRSQPKFFAVDHAMAAFVGGSFSPNVGKTLENIVFIELLRRGYSPFYWLSKQGFEVDFVIRQGRTVTHAIQVCASLLSKETQERELRALSAAAKELKPKNLQIITLDHDASVLKSAGDVEVVTFEQWALQS